MKKPAVDANFVVNAATFNMEVKSRDRFSSAVKADFVIKTETLAELRAYRFSRSSSAQSVMCKSVGQ